ncbi:MAG TPA: Clp protease N-terminal domain-containing protein, partial [Solirubrobacterales bacterium]
MRLDKLTIKAREAVQAAQELAGSRGHQELTPEHLLAALLDQAEGVTGALLRKLGVDPTLVRQSTAESLEAQPQARGSTADIFVGRRLNELLED